MAGLVLQEITSHTLKKHEILDRYLAAYLRIMSHAFPKKELLFVDGCAYTGVYAGGEEGSPIRALRKIYALDVPRSAPVRVLLIEKEKSEYDRLVEEVSRFVDDEGPRPDVIVETRNGECASVIMELIRDRDARGAELGPAFFFLDPYGYTGVPMSLVAAILSHPRCEALIYLELRRLKAHLTDPSKHESIGATFGGEGWKRAQLEHSIERTEILKAEYESSLRRVANATHVLGFTMRGEDSWPIYRLFHAARNEKAHLEMKKAMKKADPTNSFSYSDQPGGGLGLFDQGDTDDSVAETLVADFADRSDGVRMREVIARVGDTDLTTHVPPLRYLEGQRRLTFSGIGHETRRRFSYPGRLSGTLRLHFHRAPQAE